SDIKFGQRVVEISSVDATHDNCGSGPSSSASERHEGLQRLQMNDREAPMTRNQTSRGRKDAFILVVADRLCGHTSFTCKIHWPQGSFEVFELGHGLRMPQSSTLTSEVALMY